MDVLATIFQGLLDLGAAVFLPIVLFIIGLIVGMKPGKAFSSALTLGVAFTGINLLISYMGDTVGAAFTTVAENYETSLKYIDMGWAPALGLAWQWQYAFLMFPIQINYLSGKSVDWVNKMAAQGTLEAHVNTGNVPNLILTMEDMSAESFGYMCYFFFRACAMTVLMLDVNPFNQPGVEVYKKNMFRLLGKQ